MLWADVKGWQAAAVIVEHGRRRSLKEAKVEEGATDEVRYEAVACSEVGDEAAVYSGVAVEDKKRRCLGQQKSEHDAMVSKIC
jgi:hypothetical protein